MIRTKLYVAGFIVVMCASCRTPQETALSPYPEFQTDLLALRDTSKIPKPELNASSAKACHAARRVFTKTQFMGMSKANVLQLLGDPRTISDYGVAMGQEADTPLVYRFDSGLGGWQYTLLFQDGKVTKQKEEGLN